MAEKLIVIGGTAAGLSAASRARKEKPDMEIQVFEKSLRKESKVVQTKKQL